MTSSSIPGWPDRAIATGSRVNEALTALLIEARLGKRWHGLSDESRSAHRLILRTFIAGGRPPEISAFSSEKLADLKRRDLVQTKNGHISVAYPFAGEATDFSVTSEGVDNFAVCAVDALGVAAMTAKVTRVSCLCPVCRTPVETTIAADGLTHEAQSHPEARIWTGVVHVDHCAADSQCKSMRLFCCAEHLATWRETRVDMPGLDLSLAEGIQLGAAIFKPFLSEETRGAVS